MLKCFIVNFLLSILPKTRCFKIKVWVLNLVGHEIKKGARITGDIKVYGRGCISVGHDTWIGIGCTFYTSPNAKIEIGDNCDIAPQVTFHTGSHLVGCEQRRAGSGYSTPIRIQNGTWLGTNSTVLAGCQVEPGCIFGAGSLLINKKYEKNKIFGGVPAKAIRELNHS